MKNLFIIAAIMFFAGSSFCQDKNDLTFRNCENYQDSCLYIGNDFIKNLSEQKFENLELLFSNDIFFRALIPSSVVTLNDPLKTANKFKSWFNPEEFESFKLLDSSSGILIDCLRINYKIQLSYKGVIYNVEQHLFCEIDDGKIYKLSLMCSGFRKHTFFF